MNLAERRRALMMQQGDGNLALLSWEGARYVGVTSINDGYSLKTLAFGNMYTQFARFYLTTMDITEKLWGKKVKVSVDITSSVSGAGPYVRFGYILSDSSWSDFKLVGMENGLCEIVYELPTTRPSDMPTSIPLMLFINTQRYETDPLNTVTITNVRLEVVE